MNYKNLIIVVHGEPNSVFLEIFFKSIKKNKSKHPIVLIASENLVRLQMKKLKFRKNIKLIKIENFKNINLNNKSINIINIDYSTSQAFQKISFKSKKYIKKCFITAFKLIKKYKIKKFINGPINKKTFLNKNFPGITEYITSNFKIKKNAMLIFNNKLSVCPVTTHLPIKYVPKNITKKLIIEKVQLIHNFYKSRLKKKPRIAILGLNPIVRV